MQLDNVQRFILEIMIKLILQDYKIMNVGYLLNINQDTYDNGIIVLTTTNQYTYLLVSRA